MPPAALGPRRRSLTSTSTTAASWSNRWSAGSSFKRVRAAACQAPRSKTISGHMSARVTNSRPAHLQPGRPALHLGHDPATGPCRRPRHRPVPEPRASAPRLARRRPPCSRRQSMPGPQRYEAGHVDPRRRDHLAQLVVGIASRCRKSQAFDALENEVENLLRHPVLAGHAGQQPPDGSDLTPSGGFADRCHPSAQKLFHVSQGQVGRNARGIRVDWPGTSPGAS